MTEEVPSSVSTCAVGRYAPSPTGRMHIGNIFCALLAWLSVKSKGGQFVLRIEDLDSSRCRKEYSDALLEDLDFLGLEWDRGPYYQSERSELYSEALDTLSAGGFTYPCWCTRADLNAASAPHESDGRRVYPGTCRDKPLRAAQFAGKPYATRLRVPDEVISFVDAHYGPVSMNLQTECGDFVLRRSDGQWAYQLAVAVDDARMGITEVVRGRDLLSSVAQQRYLIRLLGYGAGIQYAHVPLLTNADHLRLSKRDKSLDMGCLRELYSARQIIGMLGYYAGLIPSGQECSARELLPLFDWKKVPVEDILVRI